MPTKNNDDMELRKFAVEKAVQHHANEEGDLMSTAAAILAFLTGGAAAGENPTSTKAPTPTQTADTSAGGSDANTTSPAPSGTAPVDAGTGEPLVEGGESLMDGVEHPPYSGNLKDLEQACMALAGAKGKPALADAFKSVGAAKWSEVAEDKRGDLWDHIQQAM